MFTKNQIDDFVVTAFEGGSNHWYHSLEAVVEDCFKDVKYYRLPAQGGALVFSDIDGGTHKLTATSIKEGIETLRVKYPHHYKDLIMELDDAATADVLLQCSVFGEIVYG